MDLSQLGGLLNDAVGFVLRLLGICFLVFPLIPSLRDFPVGARYLCALAMVVVYVVVNLFVTVL